MVRFIVSAGEGVRALYQLTAPRYEAEIVPLMDTLVSDQAKWIAACLQAHQRGALFDPFDLPTRSHPLPIPPPGKHTTPQVIDIGAGTGALTRHLTQMGITPLIGLDLSAHMVTEGQKRHSDSYWLQADIQHLPLKRQGFDGAVAAFGLNAAAPKPALREIRRILRPGGLLLYQEWGAEDELSHLLEDSLDHFAPDSPPDTDPALLDFMEASKPWYDQLQDAEDHVDLLKRLGFDLVWAREVVFVTVSLPLEVFIRGKLAWGWRRLRLEAISPEARAQFESQLRQRLHVHVDDQGRVMWRPPLIRVCAVCV